MTHSFLQDAHEKLEYEHLFRTLRATKHGMLHLSIRDENNKQALVDINLLVLQKLTFLNCFRTSNHQTLAKFKVCVASIATCLILNLHLLATNFFCALPALP